MPARNANDATWYILRYPENFTPREPAGAEPGNLSPRLDPTLFYDDARSVLELQPEPLDEEIRPLSGLAVDVNGEVYRVDNRTGRLLVRCGEHEWPLSCEPHVLAGPRGLALDRRGYLYVADARARRVVVLLPEDGGVRAVLNRGFLVEPVDVAASPAGRIYVADRAGGRIAIYSPGHRRLRRFGARNAEGLPETPRPIAVMIERDETVLVADANHPRLLRFRPDGKPLADVALRSLTAELKAGDVALDALEKAYGRRVPRFLVGACCPPRPTDDGGVRLAEVHRALRLLRLQLGRRFAAEGTFISAALDGGSPGTTWHCVEVDADLPAGTALTVETVTSDVATGPAGPDLLDEAVWTEHSPAEGRWPVPIDAQVCDQLVMSRPGRFLWLRLRLRADDGTATPSVRSVRLLYPRVSYLDLLPAVYRRDPDGARFMERFLALFERTFTRIEDRYEAFSRELNPSAAPREVIDWLACLVDLSFDPSWPVERRRRLVLRAMDLYRGRGTPRGVRDYVAIYTGAEAEVIEAFLQRPRAPAFLGRPGATLGCALQLGACRPEMTPEEQLYLDYAHRFTVLVYLEDPCDAEVMLPVIDRIIETNKPAHTEHTLCPIYPDARIGLQSTVGLDLVVGGRGAPRTRLGGRVQPGTSPETRPDILGVSTELGRRRPSYVRPLDWEL